LDFLPLRSGLKKIKSEPYENIQEHGIQWRLLASTLERALEEVDMASTFLKTLGSTYETMTPNI